jgi:hypothetical protein
MLNFLPDGRRDQDPAEVGQELEDIEFVEVNERSGVADNGVPGARSGPSSCASPPPPS